MDIWDVTKCFVYPFLYDITGAYYAKRHTNEPTATKRSVETIQHRTFLLVKDSEYLGSP
jgi:hypothetical protein